MIHATLDKKRFKHLCKLLQQYMDRKNPREIQRMARLKTDDQGNTLSLLTCNGSGVSTINIPMESPCPPDLDYCIQWAPLASLAKTMRTQSVEIQVLKGGLKLKLNGTKTKLASHSSKLFRSHEPKGTAELVGYVGDLIPTDIKTLVHSHKKDDVDPLTSLVSISDGYLYTCKYVSLTRVSAMFAVHLKDVYLKFLDLVAIKGMEHGTVSVTENELIIKHADGQFIMPRVKLKKDLLSLLKKRFEAVNTKWRAKTNRDYLARAFIRTRQAAGLCNAQLKITKKRITVTVIDDKLGDSAHIEQIPCEYDGPECHCISKIDLLMDCARNMNGEDLSILIPELNEPQEVLCVESGSATELVALRPHGLLRLKE